MMSSKDTLQLVSGFNATRREMLTEKINNDLAALPPTPGKYWLSISNNKEPTVHSYEAVLNALQLLSFSYAGTMARIMMASVS